METLSSLPIKMPSKNFLFVMFIENGKFWAMGAIAGLFIFLILGIFLSLKWIVVMFMWLCLVVPLCTAFLFFFYGLKPLNALNSIDHNIEFYDSYLKVNAITTPSAEKKDKDSKFESWSNKKEESEKIEEKADIKEKIAKPVLSLQYADCRQIKIYLNSLVFYFKSPSDGFLWLPLNAFERIDELSQVKKRIENHMKHN